jgi:hypothetical protein
MDCATCAHLLGLTNTLHSDPALRDMAEWCVVRNQTCWYYGSAVEEIALNFVRLEMGNWM